MTSSLLDAVVGHAPAVSALRVQLRDAQLSHALLITGPDSVGKTTVARAVASGLLGAERWPGGPAAHPDLWVEDTSAERIGIARIRGGGGDAGAGPSLQDFLALRPYAGERRVAVVGRADRLTDDAANCLLKTLEEPPPGVHILLCAASAQRLPATVVSRCQTLALGPVAPAALARWLTHVHGLDKGLAALAAPLALGRPGRALWLAREPGALAAEMEALNAFIASAGGGVGRALHAAAGLAPAGGAEGRERAALQLGVWTTFLRDVVCVAANAPELVMWTAYRGVLDAWAQALTPARAAAMLDAATAAAHAVAVNAQPRLTYEVLFIELFGGLNGVAIPPFVTPPAIDPRAPGGVLATQAAAPRKPARRAPARR